MAGHGGETSHAGKRPVGRCVDLHEVGFERLKGGGPELAVHERHCALEGACCNVLGCKLCPLVEPFLRGRNACVTIEVQA